MIVNDVGNVTVAGFDKGTISYTVMGCDLVFIAMTIYFIYHLSEHRQTKNMDYNRYILACFASHTTHLNIMDRSLDRVVLCNCYIH